MNPLRDAATDDDLDSVDPQEAAGLLLDGFADHDTQASPPSTTPVAALS